MEAVGVARLLILFMLMSIAPEVVPHVRDSLESAYSLLAASPLLIGLLIATTLSYRCYKSLHLQIYAYAHPNQICWWNH